MIYSTGIYHSWHFCVARNGARHQPTVDSGLASAHAGGSGFEGQKGVDLNRLRDAGEILANVGQECAVALSRQTIRLIPIYGHQSCGLFLRDVEIVVGRQETRQVDRHSGLQKFQN